MDKDKYHPDVKHKPASLQQNGPTDDWEERAQEAIQNVLNTRRKEQKAKNVILFIGDGMGVSTVTAARWLQQQQMGISIQDARLSFENFEHIAAALTYSSDTQTSDSASTATALMCGVKCNSGLLGVRQNVERQNCEQASNPDNQVPSYFTQAQLQGMSAGIVSTARVTHATPAAAYAHSPDRNWESDIDIPDNCNIDDIALQLLEYESNKNMQVILGGGRRAFFPKNETDYEYDDEIGERDDGKHLINEWLAYMEDKNRNAKFVYNKTDFDDIDPDSVDHLLGLFEPSHMLYEVKRKVEENEPSLTEMVDKAIKILQKNNNGYVLQVESGRIDHAHHETMTTIALEETLEFGRAVQRAVELTDPEETLLIVTADHSHVFTIAGYASYETSILGVDGDITAATDNKYYSTLAYANGPGYFVHRYNSTEEPKNDEYDEALEISRLSMPDNSDPQLSEPTFVRDATIPMESETHAGEDVLIYAQGPWAHLFQGVQEQSYIPHVIKHAACIGTDSCHENDTTRNVGNIFIIMIIYLLFC